MKNPRISELLERIRHAEEEIEQEIKLKRAGFHADFENKRAHFEHEVAEQQRRFKMGLLKYLLKSEFRNVITAPIIYVMIVPILLIDLFVSLYQYICFPLYGIACVRRSDYLIFDRTHLAYLNLIEKINCAYCSYGNGVAAYIKEVFARTEQYWCPIKHARRVLQAHPYYNGFTDFGDAESYHAELATIREKLRQIEIEDSTS